jgi:hypothetical protein
MNINADEDAAILSGTSPVKYISRMKAEKVPGTDVFQHRNTWAC